MQVTWREEKRRLNVRKHGLDFTLVRDIVSDPLAVTVFDRVEDGEERWHTIGVILTGAFPFAACGGTGVNIQARGGPGACGEAILIQTFRVVIKGLGLHFLPSVSPVVRGSQSRWQGPGLLRPS
jgi:hypothetical protein